MNSTIIILGIKHCGKSTIGRELAQRTSLPFYDVDDVLESMVGENCRQYYRANGKEAFMKAEAEAAQAIAEKQGEKRCIVATGGGICDNEAALKVLRGMPSACLIFLDIDEDTAFSRIQADFDREGTWPAYIAKENPTNASEAAQVFHRFYLRRQEAYKKISDDSVSVKDKSPLCIADEILA